MWHLPLCLEIRASEEVTSKSMFSKQEYPNSDLAKVFPDLPAEQFEDLVKSVQRNGLRDAITLQRGEVIDGRHRYEACIRAGVKPTFEYLPDDADPVQFILDKNLERRHLNPSQRAIVAYKLSSMSKPGRPANSQDDEPQITQGEAALRLQVSKRSITNVGQVLAEESTAVPTLRQAVEEGRVKISDAAKVIGQPAEVQEQALDRVFKRESKTIAGAVQQIKRELTDAEDAAPLETNRAKTIDEAITLHHAAVSDLSRLVGPDSVDAIITNPPNTAEFLPEFSDLAAFAAFVLKAEGVMVIINDTMHLPQVLENLKYPGLNWWCEYDFQHHSLAFGSGAPCRINLRRRSLLIYGKPKFRLNGGDNVIKLPTLDGPIKEPLRRHLNDAAMTLIVENFVRPGQLVCDPFLLGMASTALAARKHGCPFVGADKNEASINLTWKYLAQDGGDAAS